MNKILLFVLVLVFCLKAKAQVTNDDCVNATQITLDANGNACVNGTTANALGVTYTAHPCWPTFQDIPEVWYTFVTSGTDNTITVTPTGGTPAQQVGVTVMSTNCAAPINNCDVSATNGGAATTNWTYVVGTQVWVNVGSMVSTGGFQICISSNTPPPNPGGSCATATTLCNKNPFTVATFPNNSNGLQPSCFPTTFQRPVFYQFTVGTSGTCGWTAAPNGPAEFDWVMYDITGGCPNGASPTFNCNFNFDFENGSPCGMQAGAPNNCPNDGSLTSGAANEFCPLQNVVAGNTYMIIIDNWTDDNTGFDFSFGGSFTIAPTAQFTMSANTSCAPPLNVTFTNTSTTTVSQTWNFGNGNTSTAVAGPAQTYTASGTYIVSLTGVSATGCPDVFTQNITVGVPPTVTVPANTTVCAGVTIPAAVFTSTPAGATYTWTNTNTAIGLGASGSANIPAFTATNATGAAITGVVSVTPTLNGCVGAPVSYTITVDPTPSIPAVTSQTVCAGVNTTAINFNPTPATATVNWTNSDNTIGVGSSGAGDIAAFAGTNGGSTVLTGNFVATPTENGCTGTPQNFSITVNPIPSIPAVTSQTVCAGVNTAAINFNPTPGTATVNWTNSDNTIGVGASGAGNIAAFAGTNAGSVPATGNFVATPTLNGCTGTAQNFAITVNPTPSIPAVTSQTVCVGVNTAAINFNPTPATATVNWTNSDNTIGVGSSGAGDIAAFAGINAGSTVLTGNFVATPTENGCTGTPRNFSITVNPIPSIPAVTSQTVCAGVNTTAITFNPTPATATVNWTNSDNTIGVGSSGAGDIAAFVGVNAGSTTVTGNFVATPTENGCTGTSQNFAITVNPTPSIPAVTSQTVCAGVNTTTITFNPTPATATVNWTNSDNTIGVGASGAGDIAAFTGTNTGSTVLTGNFVATPTENGCTGTAQNFSITVDPIPSVPTVADQTVCAGVNTAAINFNPTPGTATVNWTNSDNSIGVGSSGAGNIAAFAGVNGSSSPVTGNFVATPTENGCDGVPINFSITVNPIPSIPAVTSQTVCAGVNTTAITFNPTPATATVNWTNSDNTIGVGAFGAGDIAAFTGTNTGSTVLTGNFGATPTENGCTGTAQNFSITV
ncbi:MAG: PKD-like domain-containing protein, partial [Bacteroidota bacterium]|nr:PKD-like domain-containing protein [Bacteroidota bacterium]